MASVCSCSGWEERRNSSPQEVQTHGKETRRGLVRTPPLLIMASSLHFKIFPAVSLSARLWLLDTCFLLGTFPPAFNNCPGGVLSGQDIFYRRTEVIHWTSLSYKQADTCCLGVPETRRAYTNPLPQSLGEAGRGCALSSLSSVLRLLGGPKRLHVRRERGEMTSISRYQSVARYLHGSVVLIV